MDAVLGRGQKTEVDESGLDPKEFLNGFGRLFRRTFGWATGNRPPHGTYYV